MSQRLLTSIMSLWLLSCAGSSTKGRETVAGSHGTSSHSASKPAPGDGRQLSASATDKAEPKTTRDAKMAEFEEDWPPQDFSGVDVAAPVDLETDDGPREVVVKGIEGTTTRYDVRTTLESRAEEFDRCHDQVGGGSGRIVFRIHIKENGDVGQVKVHTKKVRNRKLVDCYTEVVAGSHFTRPNGGYADVKWTTKVGRSPKRPDAVFERRGRWDAPAGSSATSPNRRKRRNNGA